MRRGKNKRDDADEHAFRVDVDGFEMSHFAQAQPSGVGGHEEDALQQVAAGVEETNEFLLAVEFRQLAQVLAAHVQVEGCLAENLPIQEGDGGGPPFGVKILAAPSIPGRACAEPWKITKRPGIRRAGASFLCPSIT